MLNVCVMNVSALYDIYGGHNHMCLIFHRSCESVSSNPSRVSKIRIWHMWTAVTKWAYNDDHDEDDVNGKGTDVSSDEKSVKTLMAITETTLSEGWDNQGRCLWWH